MIDGGLSSERVLSSYLNNQNTFKLNSELYSSTICWTFTGLYVSILSHRRTPVPSIVVLGESCGVAAVVIIVGGSRFGGRF